MALTPNRTEAPSFGFAPWNTGHRIRAADASRDESIILIVLNAPNGDLSLLVSPTLRQIVQGSDLAYIDSLLKDFVVRATLRPSALFEQLCSLGVGPLVTYELGSSLTDHPHISQLCSSFKDLLGNLCAGA